MSSVHGQPGEVETRWDSGTDGCLSFGELVVGDGLFFGDDVQPGHVHTESLHAVVVDGPVVIVGGEDAEWVSLLGLGHGSLTGGARLEGLIALVEGTVDTLVGECHHWEHSSEVEVKVAVGVELVLLGLALLSHFVGERGVSLDLVPLAGESGLVEGLDGVGLWASTEAHSGFSSHNGRGGEGKYCLGVHFLDVKEKLNKNYKSAMTECLKTLINDIRLLREIVENRDLIKAHWIF